MTSVSSEWTDYWTQVSDDLDKITNLQEKGKRPVNDFKPKYTIEDIANKVKPLYSELWKYFDQGDNFDRHVTDFFAHLQDINVDTENSVLDPKELGAALIKFMEMRRAEFAKEESWYPAKKVPSKFPATLVQKHLHEMVGDAMTTNVEVLCIGDIHGCLSSILNTMKTLLDREAIDENWKILDPNLIIVFTGNLGDRGFFGMECYLIVLYLLIQNPKQVFALRGTHDFGAETDLRYDESPMKMKLPINMYSRIMWRLAEAFPEMLFFATADPIAESEDGAYKNRRYAIFAHGAIEPGYAPEGFLYHSCKAPFHSLEQYDRSAFFEHLKRTQPAFWERIEKQEDFSEIPVVVRTHATAIKGGGPLWNSYNKSEIGLEMGRDNNGVRITRELLESCFEYWSEQVSKSATKGKFGTMRRLSSTIRRSSQVDIDRKKVTFETTIGGCGQNFIKTARKGKGMFAVFEKTEKPEHASQSSEQEVARFLVYKSTVAHDILPYLLDEVSVGHLMMNVAGDWQMKSQVIADGYGLFEGSASPRAKFAVIAANL